MVADMSEPKLSKRDQERIARLEAARQRQREHETSAQPAPAETPQPGDASRANSAALLPLALAPRPVSQVAEGRTASAATRLQLDGLKSGLLGEVEELRAEVAELRPYKEMSEGGAVPTLSVDPREVAPTRYFNRFSQSISPDDPNFAKLLDDIRGTKGNKVAGGMRLYTGTDQAYKYEVIHGSRRLAACQIAVETDPEVRFKAVLETVADEREARLLQQVENRLRLNPSVIEQALSVRSYFTEMYGTANGQPKVPDGATLKFASEVKMHPKHVSKLLLAGSTPESVLSKLGDVRKLTTIVLLKLARAWRDEPEQVKERLRTIPKGASPKAAALHVAGASRDKAAPKPISIDLAEVEDAPGFLAELTELAKRHGVELEIPETPGGPSK